MVTLDSNSIRITNDLDMRWPVADLVDAIGFETRVRHRVRDYLEARHIETLSLRGLMDLIVPASVGGSTSRAACWGYPPILDQPQFGWLLYVSALLRLTGADLGLAFRTELALRVYHRMIMSYLWLAQQPVPRRARRTKGPAQPRIDLAVLAHSLILPPRPGPLP